ncbi:MAG TPA: hypothetical protein VLX12_12575 [Syntrophorhabdales bacterium]|nr:hypothetical protein [Syntrophorhabdales bacterium]
MDRIRKNRIGNRNDKEVPWFTGALLEVAVAGGVLATAMLALTGMMLSSAVVA